MLQAGASEGFMKGTANTGEFGKKPGGSIATKSPAAVAMKGAGRKKQKRGFLRHLAGAFTGR